ncbi:MAG: DNA-directed RNA polymerase subunit alpha [Prevotellaceae bacterium]|jgi:DNA-directed RNA polymerase subunit alpha|nr:DNA-directed RNA polymerase subunit alpha [Prevotellaceae bacterium]
MAILAFQKPNQVIMLEANDVFGRFEFRPLEPGYGTTVGNALRRVLLSSLEGYAITSVKISGIDHEFTTIPGVIENVVDIILNLKKVRLKKNDSIEGIETEKVNINVSGQTVLTAKDLNANMSVFKVLNPELVICNMDENTKFQMQLTIGQGRGWVPAEENKLEITEFGVIPVDSIFTPIINVNFTTEDFRVEQKTDYEKLIIEITTDGSVHPKEALKKAAKILINHFMLFCDEKITIEAEETIAPDEFDEELLRIRQLLKQRLTDMELSVRALNCLKAADIKTLGELVKLSRNDLLRFRNFGKKSLTELDELLETLKLSFGMDVSKYKLDKE